MSLFISYFYARWYKNLFAWFFICEFNNIKIMVCLLYRSHFQSDQMTIFSLIPIL